MDACDVVIGRLVREIGRLQAYKEVYQKDTVMKSIFDAKIEANKKAITIIREEFELND